LFDGTAQNEDFGLEQVTGDPAIVINSARPRFATWLYNQPSSTMELLRGWKTPSSIISTSLHQRGTTIRRGSLAISRRRWDQSNQCLRASIRFWRLRFDLRAMNSSSSWISCALAYLIKEQDPKS